MSGENDIDTTLAYLSKKVNKLPDDTDLMKLMQEKKEQFFLHLQDIIEDLKEATRAYDSSGKVEKHIERIMYYVVADRNGRLGCGSFVITTYELFAPTVIQTEENLKLAAYLGCCLEMFKGVAYIIDDIMDKSMTRRKKPCWHKLEDVQLSAINDAFMLETAIFVVLKKYFSHLNCYASILEILSKCVFVGGIGEYLDIQTKYQDFTTFTMEQYRKLTNLKTSIIGGFIAVSAALHLAGVTDPEVFHNAMHFCVELGAFFQFQNDFTDCYADPEDIGKVGTDIEQGKCTWLACKFLELANPEQKEIFKTNYGKVDPLCVARIKHLYDEVSMVDICLKYEDETYERLRNNKEFSVLSRTNIHYFAKVCHKYTKKN